MVSATDKYAGLLESNVDVVIVGAGPAGYMAATWLARFKGLKVRFVEKRNTKIFAGQADGLQCRTLEVFQSFGFADRALKEANHMLEICFWDPDKNRKLTRTGRIPDMTPNLSRFTQIVMHQGFIEGYFKDFLAANSDIEVEYGTMPEHIEIDESKVEDDSEYPVRLVLRKLPEEEDPEQFGHKVQNGLFRSTNLTTATQEDASLDKDDVKREVVNAKYVIGADGAHSWVRRQLGHKMEGDTSDYVWGVLDIVPLTDFPDIRYRCAIHSEKDGSVMVIPRENGLVRLYIQLSEVKKDANGCVDRTKITPEMILKAAQKIMFPYKLEYNQINWFTAYQIGQRVANKFQTHERVFLAGDACHTHSPKAGQGMNVSMMDSYNLAWKIGSVCQNRLQRSVLKTYEAERQQIANDLISFDRKFAKLFSSKPGEVSLEEFKKMFAESHLFASGVAVEYSVSDLVAKDADKTTSKSTVALVVKSKQALATGLPVGRRFNSFKVLNQSDAKVWHFQDTMPSDGRWRVVLFAGDIRDSTQKARIEALGKHLDQPTSWPAKYTPADAKQNSVIQLLTIHSAPRWETELSDFPKSIRPEHDYWSVFVDDVAYHDTTGNAYENYGVDKTKGALVVVRPDQYVSLVADVDDVESVERFFEGCLRPVKA